MIKAVIFDMDGVLIDSERYQYKSFEILFKKYKLNFDDFDWIGKTAEQNIKDILNKNKSKLNINQLSKEKRTIYHKIIKSKIKTKKYAIPILKYLKKEKIKIGLASQSKIKNINFIFSLLKIKKYFDFIVSSEDVKSSKPHPEIYIKICKKLKVSPKESIVIEDSPIGIKSAISAGLTCAGLITEFYNKKKLKDADYLLNNLMQIKKLI